MTEQGPIARGVKVGLCGWTIAQASYLRRFPLVEVQHTFYDPPAGALLARWRAGVPKHFRVHDLQCPRSFRPTAVNVDRMRTFLTTVQRPASRLLWEPRGDWPVPLIVELCRELDLAHVVDPMQTETVTPEQTYYRLHGTNGMRLVHTDD